MSKKGKKSVSYLSVHVRTRRWSIWHSQHCHVVRRQFHLLPLFHTFELLQDDEDYQLKKKKEEEKKREKGKRREEGEDEKYNSLQIKSVSDIY